MSGLAVGHIWTEVSGRIEQKLRIGMRLRRFGWFRYWLHVRRDPQEFKAEAEKDATWGFPSTRKTGLHINHAQRAIEQIAERSGVEFRGHDLLWTAASLMVGVGVPRLVVSKILNHVESGVTAVSTATATTRRSARRWTSGVGTSRRS